MGDPLSTTTAALELFKTAVAIGKYIKDVKDSSKTKKLLRIQIGAVEGNLEWIKTRGNEVLSRPDHAWTPSFERLLKQDDRGIWVAGDLLAGVKQVFEKLRKKLRARETIEEEGRKEGKRWEAKVAGISAPWLWPLIEKGVRDLAVELDRLNQQIGLIIQQAIADIVNESNKVAGDNLMIAATTLGFSAGTHSIAQAHLNLGKKTLGVSTAAQGVAQENLKLGYRTQKDVESVKTTVETAADEILSFRREWKEGRKDDDFLALLSWISPDVVEDPQDKVPPDLRIPGDWLVKDEVVAAWLGGRSWILKIDGEPGHGKSVMASYIAQHLRDLSTPVEPNVVLSLYLNHEKQDIQSTYRLLGLILKQLLADQNSEDMEPKLLEIWKQCKKVGSHLNQVDLLSTIEIELKKRKKAYLIVDGLDEAQSEVKAELCAVLAELKVRLDQQPTLNLLYTSRPQQSSPPRDLIGCNNCGGTEKKSISIYFTCKVHGDDFHLCESCARKQTTCGEPPHDLREPYETLDLILEADESVIRSYVQKLLHRIKTRGTSGRNGDLSNHGKLPNYSTYGVAPLALVLRDDPELENDIMMNICSGAGGSFLLARAQVEYITNSASGREAEELLQTLPSSVNSMYEAALRRIHEQPTDLKEKGLQLLMWLVCSKRVLRYGELQDALSVHLRDYLKPATGLHSEQRDKRVFSPTVRGRVIMDVYLGATAGLLHFSRDGGVRLMHRTAYAFFENLLESPTEWAKWFPADAHRQMALTCMAYLFHSKAGIPCSGDDTTGQIKAKLSELPLLSYASQHWGTHARLAQNDADVQRMVIEFLNNTSALAAAAQASEFCDFTYPTGWDVSKGVSPVHIAAWFDLDFAIDKVGQNHDISARDSTSLGRTPLIYAARNGSIQTIRQLIAAGVNINDTDAHGFSALHHACERDKVEAIKELCRHKDLMVNRLEPDGMSCLMLAARRPNAESVRALAKATGTQLNLMTKDGSTALAISVEPECAAATEVLLDLPNIEINAADTTLRTPLHRAAMRGHSDAVHFLLRKGADCTLRDKRGCTPLCYGVLGGHADVLTEFENYSSVGTDGAVICKSELLLHAASESGSKDTVSWVLNRGAAVDAIDTQGRTALHIAAGSGYDEIAQLLLDNAASAKAADFEGVTPAKLALDEGFFTTANIIEGTSAQYSIDSLSTLVLAKRGHEDILKERLKKRPQDVWNTDKRCRTPLHYAAQYDHQSCVRAVLDAGKNEDLTNAVDKFGVTPVMLACGRPSKSGTAILELLLAHTPASDLDGHCDPNGIKALDVSLRQGDMDSAALLVGAGASFPANFGSDHLAECMLLTAIEKSNVKTVERLLEIGVEPHHPHLEAARLAGNGEVVSMLRQPRRAKEIDLVQEGESEVKPEATGRERTGEPAETQAVV